MRQLTCLALMLTLLAGCELDGEGPSQAPEGNATSFELDSKPVGDSSRAPYEGKVQGGIEIPARD
jgi:hypothetical protein